MRNKMTKIVVILLATTLGGCVTVSGNYVVSAVDAAGKPIDSVFFVQGRHIYTARNGICAAHPGAKVYIRSAETKADLKGESPYQCR